MYRILGTDGKEYGPVDAEQIRAWMTEGRVNGQTKIQLEGSLEWKQVRDLPEFAPSTPRTDPPVFTPTTAASPSQEEILAHEGSIGIMDCMNHGWALLVRDFGLLFSATVVIWLANFVIMFVPLIGGILSLLFKGVLYGGLYRLYLKRLRNEPATIGDAFSGFSENMPQLILAGLVTWLLSFIGFCCLILPWVYLTVAWTFTIPLVADKKMEFWSAMETSRKVVTRNWFQVLGLLIICFVPAILFNCYAMVKSVTMVMNLLPQLQNSQPDMATMMNLMGTSFVLGMVGQICILLCMPLMLAATAYAYESLFGARPARST